MARSFFRPPFTLTFFGTLLCFSGCSSKPDTATIELLEKLREEVRQVHGKLSEPVGREYISKLDSIQSKLLDPAADGTAATEEFAKLRDSLPALAAIELSRPLGAIDWLVRMKSLLREGESAESLSEAAALLDEVPDSLENDVASQYASLHAKKVLSLCQILSANSKANAESVELAIEMLEQLESDGQADSKLDEIKSALAAKSRQTSAVVLHDALKKDVATLETQLKSALTITDTEVRYSAVTTIGNALDNLRTQLALQGHNEELASTADIKEKVNAAVEDGYQGVSAKQQSSLRKARMRYQAWTLGEIEKFNALVDPTAIDKELYRLRDDVGKSKDPSVVRWLDFKGVRSLFESALGKASDNFQLTTDQQANVGAFVKNNWYPILYQVKHDAAVRHLLHIDQGLLDPPVAKFYNDAFEGLWKDFTDRKDLQLSLARMTAEVPKRGLENFTKEQTK